MPGYQALFVLEPELRKKQGFHKHLQLSPTGLETLLLLTKEAESYLDVKQPGNCFAAIMTFQRLLFFLAGYFGRQPDPARDIEVKQIVQFYGVALRGTADAYGSKSICGHV